MPSWTCRADPMRGGRQGLQLHFASVLQGPASLSIDPNYLELGPMFCLDYLDWRPALPAKSATVLGTISPKQFDEMREILTGAAADDEEPLRLLRKKLSKKTPGLNERFLLPIALCMRSNELCPELPRSNRWRMDGFCRCGSRKDDQKRMADSDFDAGKCDAGAVDQRLASMLASDELPSQSRGQA